MSCIFSEINGVPSSQLVSFLFRFYSPKKLSVHHPSIIEYVLISTTDDLVLHILVLIFPIVSIPTTGFKCQKSMDFFSESWANHAGRKKKQDYQAIWRSFLGFMHLYT